MCFSYLSTSLFSEVVSESFATSDFEVVVELSEDEKIVIGILSEEKQTLAEAKDKSGLSGKKWDTATKSLRQKDLINIVVEGDNKFITIK